GAAAGSEAEDGHKGGSTVRASAKATELKAAALTVRQTVRQIAACLFIVYLPPAWHRWACRCANVREVALLPRSWVPVLEPSPARRGPVQVSSPQGTGARESCASLPSHAVATKSATPLRRHRVCPAAALLRQDRDAPWRFRARRKEQRETPSAHRQVFLR